MGLLGSLIRKGASDVVIDAISNVPRDSRNLFKVEFWQGDTHFSCLVSNTEGLKVGLKMPYAELRLRMLDPRTGEEIK